MGTRDIGHNPHVQAPRTRGEKTLGRQLGSKNLRKAYPSVFETDNPHEQIGRITVAAAPGGIPTAELNMQTRSILRKMGYNTKGRMLEFMGVKPIKDNTNKKTAIGLISVLRHDVETDKARAVIFDQLERIGKLEEFSSIIASSDSTLAKGYYEDCLTDALEFRASTKTTKEKSQEH